MSRLPKGQGSGFGLHDVAVLNEPRLGRRGQHGVQIPIHGGLQSGGIPTGILRDGVATLMEEP